MFLNTFSDKIAYAVNFRSQCMGDRLGDIDYAPHNTEFNCPRMCKKIYRPESI